MPTPSDTLRPSRAVPDAGPEPPIGRLAPSPTGRLHLGHARTFLLAWWSVRSRGGRILLRIEDLDAGRVKPGMSDALLRDLEWLGLDWDGAPLLQSSDTRAMAAAVDTLLSRGLAYPCVCSRRDIQSALSAPQGSSSERRYPGTCRGRVASVADAERTSGVRAGVRFSVPPGAVTILDALRGPHSADVARDTGDFLIARRDGAYAYQLAVVVDDARCGVTEVLRGDDLLPSTPRQWLLQNALGLPHPTWIHVPLVHDEHGERLAKRSDSLSLAALRDQGIDPRAVIAWIARSAGLDAPEPLTAVEALPRFDLARLPQQPVRFGPSERANLATSPRSASSPRAERPILD